MLHCYRCKERKNESEFYKDKTRNSGYSSKCKVCANEEADIKYNRRRKPRRLSKKGFIEGLRSKGCAICGYCACGSALEFHHIDPSEKEGNVPDIKFALLFLKEVEKCVILCANCHREVHAGMHSTSNLPRAYILSEEQLKLI